MSTYAKGFTAGLVFAAERARAIAERAAIGGVTGKWAGAADSMTEFAACLDEIAKGGGATPTDPAPAPHGGPPPSSAPAAATAPLPERSVA